MDLLFLKLLNLSINASILIAAVLIFRLIFKKAPKWINCLLWALVGIRLILPFSLESSISLIPKKEVIPSNIIYELNPKINTSSTVVNEYINNSLATNMGDSVTKTAVIMYISGFIWLIGLVLMLSYSVISYLVLRHKLNTSTLYVDGVKQSDRIASPFVLGIFKPMIYIPYTLNSQDLEFVIAHEKAHIKRKDYLWKPLGFLILSIYWFNPIIWISYIFLCRDIESACDEKVISELDSDARKNYSFALLNCSIKQRAITACPVAFGETGVKSRIKGIMNYKKPAFWVIVIAIVSCIVVGICFITNPKSENNTSNTASDVTITEESSITSVGGAEQQERFIMSATITEVGDGYMLVTPSEGSWELSSSDCFNIPTINMLASPEPEVGDTVEIEHNGVIQELYPASFLKVFFVTVIKDESSLSASESEPDAPNVGLVFVSRSSDEAMTNLLGFTDWECEVDDVAGVHFTISIYSTDGHIELGRWFGFNPNPIVYVEDIDGDGNNEMICNCQYGGDGVQDVCIYRNNNGVIELLTVSEKFVSEAFNVEPQDICPPGMVIKVYNPETNLIEITFDGIGETSVELNNTDAFDSFESPNW